MEYHIECVDAPDKRDKPDDDEFWSPPEEHQRTYKVAAIEPNAKVHTVRIRFDFDVSAWAFVIENLVGGKWHRLLTGEVRSGPGGYGREPIDFDAQALRAAKVLA